MGFPRRGSSVCGAQLSALRPGSGSRSQQTLEARVGQDAPRYFLGKLGFPNWRGPGLASEAGATVQKGWKCSRSCSRGRPAQSLPEAPLSPESQTLAAASGKALALRPGRERGSATAGWVRTLRGREVLVFPGPLSWGAELGHPDPRLGGTKTLASHPCNPD